jgi:hypothetical protein
MAGVLGTQYTKEQIDAIPGLANALKSAIDTGIYANQSPAQSARRFLDYAMKDPVAWVSDDLRNSIYSGYYNNNDYTLTKSQIDYLKKSNVPQSQITSTYETALASANKEIADRESSKSFNPLALIGGLALSFFLPGISSALSEFFITEGIVTSQVAADLLANTIVNTTANIAQGQSPEDALKNSFINTVVNTGSVEAAKEINKFITDKRVVDAIVSAGGSAVKTAAAGGTEQDIVRNMTGALAGSAASSAYQSAGDDYTRSTGRLIGSTVAGYITGGGTGAVSNLLGELGSQSKGKVAGTIEDTFRGTTDTGALPASQVAAMTTKTDAGPAALNQVDVTGKALPTDITSTNIIDTIARTTPGTPPPPTISTPPKLENVEVSGKALPKATDITDTDVINAITAEKKPNAVLQRVEVSGKALPTDITKTDIIDEPAKLQDVTVTGKKEEPLALETKTITGKADGTLAPVTITGKADEPAATTEEKKTEEPAPKDKPYKPDLFILSGKQPKTTTKSSDSVLGQALGTTTGLTASRGAGEIEDPSTGKKKRKVWNEETLRLKDALGV